MTRISKTLFLLACFGLLQTPTWASASYSASASGTLTLTALGAPLIVDFFDADPTHSNTAFDGIQVFGNGGSSAGTSIIKTPGASSPTGDATTQLAGASGSQKLPGFVTTDVLTTVLLDIHNPSTTDTASFTIRWDWALAVSSAIDDPAREMALANAAAFFDDATGGSTLDFHSLSAFGTDASSDSGFIALTLSIAPLGRQVIITGVDANGAAGVLPLPGALGLMLVGLLTMRRLL